MFYFTGISLYAFQQFSPVIQLHWVLRWGAFLANRWENEGGLNLYYYVGDGRGFFVEVGADDGRGQVVLRSFSESGPLVDYAHGVRLPGV